MEPIFLFVLLSIPILLFPWRNLFDFSSHGFYRFFSWECILWLLVNNYIFWFDDPFSIRQIFSWIFLFWSVYAVIAGVVLLKKSGKHSAHRNGNSLYQFEKTTELVDTGIFKYIRHPLYSSLLFLTWGIFLKHASLLLSPAALLSTLFLYLTALSDEKECIKFFGEKYTDYIKRSKRFIPLLF